MVLIPDVNRKSLSMIQKKIIYAGTIRGGKHQQDQIISIEGICKCLTSGSHLNADWMTLILDDRDEDKSSDRAGQHSPHR